MAERKVMKGNVQPPEPSEKTDPFAYYDHLFSQDPFLRLISPVGPLDTLQEHERWYQHHLQQISLQEVLNAIHHAHARYPRWLNDVEVAAHDFADLHPEHAPQVHAALASVGFEVK